MVKKTNKKEETLNLETILFKCRDILRQVVGEIMTMMRNIGTRIVKVITEKEDNYGKEASC